MNPVLERLAARALGLPPAIRPRPHALFEPVREPGDADTSELPEIAASAEPTPPLTVARTGGIAPSEHAVDAPRPTSGAEAPGQTVWDLAASGAVASAAPRTPTPRRQRTLEPPSILGRRAEPQARAAAAPPGDASMEANERAEDHQPPRALAPAAGPASGPDPFRAVGPDERTANRPPRPLIDIERISASSDAPPAHPIGPQAWADEGAQAAPDINISIGCIEVRATTDAKPKPPAARDVARRRPAFISLEDYLKRGARGGS